MNSVASLPPIQLTPTELGWVAGILEGEGCFYQAIVQNGKSKSLATKIVVGMTDEDVVARLALLCGSKVAGPYTKYSGKGRKRKQTKSVWCWSICGQNAINLMLIVRHLMGARRTAKIDEIVAVFLASISKRRDHARNNGRKQVAAINARGVANGWACRARGKSHPQAKLTGPKVVTIRRGLRNGDTKAALARRFRVSETAIRSIANGNTWQHIK